MSLTVGLLTLLFLVEPALQPGNDPAALGAELSGTAVESGVALGDYYDRIGVSPPSGDAEFLGTPGVVVTFDLAISGYEGEENHPEVDSR